MGAGMRAADEDRRRMWVRAGVLVVVGVWMWAWTRTRTVGVDVDVGVGGRRGWPRAVRANGGVHIGGGGGYGEPMECAASAVATPQL